MVDRSTWSRSLSGNAAVDITGEGTVFDVYGAHRTRQWPSLRPGGFELDLTNIDGLDEATDGAVVSYRGGFRNSGNTCYLAAVIHSLMAAPSIRRTILEHSCCIGCSSPCPCIALRASEMASRCGGASDLIHWRPLLEEWGLEWGRQQSVHELLFSLTADMDDTQKVPFRLWVTTHTQSLCTCRAAVKVNSVPETTVELKMEDIHDRGSLASALNGLGLWHTVEDASYMCDCGGRGSFYKRRLDFADTGDALVLALARERDHLGKSRAMVRVDDGITINYRDWNLRAVVVHRGMRSDSGHYVAYIRDEDRGFVLFDDATAPELHVSLPDEVHTDGVLFVYGTLESESTDVHAVAEPHDCSRHEACYGHGSRSDNAVAKRVGEAMAKAPMVTTERPHRKRKPVDATAAVGVKSEMVSSKATLVPSATLKRENDHGHASVVDVKTENLIPGKSPNGLITDEQREYIRFRYHTDRASQKTIARDMGIGVRTVHKIATQSDPIDTQERRVRTVVLSPGWVSQRRELERTKMSNKRRTDKPSLEERKEKAREMSKTMTYREIADILGVTSRSIGQWLKRGSAGSASPEDSWRLESSKCFSLTEVLSPVRFPIVKSAKQTEYRESDFIALASWTFCIRCGRRRPGKLIIPQKDKCTELVKWYETDRVVEMNCIPSCDLSPDQLEHQLDPNDNKRGDDRVKFYVTPNVGDWPDVFLNQDGTPALDKAERQSLQLIYLDATYNIVRGMVGSKAPVTNMKKTAVIKATWREDDVERALPTNRARAAFHWLLEHNATYREYLTNQRRARDDRDGSDRSWRNIPTAQLLLHMPGVEVAARPWLYPTAAFGDTDHKVRLMQLNRMEKRQCPSVKTSFYHKLMSRCQSYQTDFALQCLLYDIYLARRISSVVEKAKEQRRAPDDIAQDMQNFSVYWLNERAKLEDVCRQRGKPNLFFTVAPAEWKFPIHQGMLQRIKQDGDKAMTNAQAIMTLHMYHCMSEIVELLANEGFREETGIKKINEYSMRFEFQGRGTLHVHVVAWAELHGGKSDKHKARQLCGKTGEPHNSELVTFLERIFKGSVDVQVGEGDVCLLRYVTGYVAKASDALQFKTRESESAGINWDKAAWRQIYRMLCKKAPTQPEIILEMAGVPQMVSSYRGEVLFAPVPGHRSVANQSRYLYNAYQQWMSQRSPEEVAISFVSWARSHRVIVIPPKCDGEATQFRVKERGKWGRGSNKNTQALGLRFPWERLDIFIGAWCATFIPHTDESEFVLNDEDAASTPEGTHFLKAALQHPHFRKNESPIQSLIDEITLDLELRGVSRDDRLTFAARLHACERLLYATAHGIVDPRSWCAKRPTDMPARIWSPQQQQVLDTVAAGISVADANVEVNRRFLHVTGGPGTGKTEVIVQCAVNAAVQGDAKVLIGCPVGSLLDTYRLRLPPKLDIVVETIHSAFRVTRQADEMYVPPGRLRMYDLIIFDEVSQIDPHVWNEVSQALSELVPGPFVVLVGDFQQLQPVMSGQGLQERLNVAIREGGLVRIELLQHAYARCRDTVMIKFLNWIRTHQPSLETLRWFFGRSGFMPKSPWAATRFAVNRERATVPHRPFTFLTVSNDTAAKLNQARIDRDYPQILHGREDESVEGDEKAGGGRLLFEPGMRIRLTRNVAKDRGFVNGALGEVEHVLRRGGNNTVFVLKASNDVRVLAHSVTLKGKTFMPAAYSYAMTVRRAQGMTLDMVGLRFDVRNPNGGYAYVGASRVRRRCDLYHVGKLRRSDWVPVGGDADGPAYQDTTPGTQSNGSQSDDDRMPYQPDDSSDYSQSSSLSTHIHASGVDLSSSLSDDTSEISDAPSVHSREDETESDASAPRLQPWWIAPPEAGNDMSEPDDVIPPDPSNDNRPAYNDPTSKPSRSNTPSLSRSTSRNATSSSESIISDERTSRRRTWWYEIPLFENRDFEGIL